MDSIAAPIPDLPARNATRARSPARVRRAVLWGLLIALFAIELVAGAQLRQSAWDNTANLRAGNELELPMHWGWGQRALVAGPTRLYANLRADATFPSDFVFDYPPLRLALITAWARWTNQHFPDSPAWQSSRDFNAPLLHLNTLFAALSAAGVFFLVRRWCLRADLAPAPEIPRPSWLTRACDALTGHHTPRPFTGPRPTFFDQQPRPRPFQGVGRAGLAASLAWFSPAILLDAHAAALLDVWIAPFFIWAVFAAISEQWLIAGLLIGAGCMLDTTLLWIAPMFVLWPLIACAPRATLRALVGFAAAIALIASPWLVGNGILWLVGALFVPVLLVPWRARNRTIAPRWILIPIAFELIFWPTLFPANRTWISGVVLAALAVVQVGAGLRLGRHWLACQVALAAAAGLFLCPLLFGGSYDWARASVLPALDVQELTLGAQNVPWILEKCFNLKGAEILATVDLPAFHIHFSITSRHALIAGYFVLLALACWSIARHEDRDDRRFLIAIILPWLLLNAIMPEMRANQFALAAGISAVIAAAGLGMAMLHLVITAVSVIVIAQSLLPNAPKDFPTLLPALAASQNAWAWIVVLLSGLAAWCAWAPRPRLIVSSR